MKEIIDYLTKNNLTISTMESATGGYLASSITNIDGSSLVFKFGAVTYSNEFKIKMGVNKDIIEKYTVYSMETAKEIKIRKLKSTDIFMMSKILNEIGFREFKDVFVNARNDYEATKKGKKGKESMASIIESVGFTTVLDALGVVIANMERAEDSIFKFVASLTEEDVETIENLPPEDFIKLINDIVRGDGFKNFFEAVTSLFS